MKRFGTLVRDQMTLPSYSYNSYLLDKHLLIAYLHLVDISADAVSCMFLQVIFLHGLGDTGYVNEIN